MADDASSLPRRRTWGLGVSSASGAWASSSLEPCNRFRGELANSRGLFGVAPDFGAPSFSAFQNQSPEFISSHAHLPRFLTHLLLDPVFVFDLHVVPDTVRHPVPLIVFEDFEFLLEIIFCVLDVIYHNNGNYLFYRHADRHV